MSHIFASEQIRRIHDGMRTDGAKAAAIEADRIYAQAPSLDNPVHGWTEARQWIAQGLAIDKASADGDIAEMAKKFARKEQRAAAARELAANVVSIERGA